jgi:hypothetical protein
MKHKHHIIPRHMGGTDDPSNLIELTVDEHAEAHRILYEQHGNWKDYLAWKGLSGYFGKEEIIQYKNRMAHLGKDPWNKGLKGYRAGVKQSEDHIFKRSKNFMKTYEITHPNGMTELVTGINEFARNNGLTAQNLMKVANGKRPHHKGYVCRRII